MKPVDRYAAVEVNVESTCNMPLDLSDQALHILPQPTPYHLLQYPPETQIPLSLFTNPTYAFASVIKTPEEISVVVSSSTEDASKLTTIDGLGEARESDGPWVALRVQGPMELSEGFVFQSLVWTKIIAMTGVMNELTKPFVEGKIAVFALSTW